VLSEPGLGIRSTLGHFVERLGGSYHGVKGSQVGTRMNCNPVYLDKGKSSAGRVLWRVVSFLHGRQIKKLSLTTAEQEKQKRRKSILRREDASRSHVRRHQPPTSHHIYHQTQGPRRQALILRGNGKCNIKPPRGLREIELPLHHTSKQISGTNPRRKSCQASPTSALSPLLPA
jgi:hypothetical protein